LVEQLSPPERQRTKPTVTALEEEAQKLVSTVIKARTQTLQQRILDGFLGIDDHDPYRVTRLIKKLMDHKPDVAVRLLSKLLPNLSDADLQKNLQKPQATINIFNNNAPPSQNIGLQTNPTQPTTLLKYDQTIPDTEFLDEVETIDVHSENSEGIILANEGLDI